MGRRSTAKGKGSHIVELYDIGYLLRFALAKFVFSTDANELVGSWQIFLPSLQIRSTKPCLLNYLLNELECCREGEEERYDNQTTFYLHIRSSL